jgi:hypothetical protein
MAGMGTSLARTLWVSQLGLQLGRLLMQPHRGPVGGQLPLLDLDESVDGGGGCLPGLRRRPSG